MAIRPITIVGHKALHSPTKRVKEITDDIRTLVDDMFETMEAANGVGLAANQVGVKQRIFVYDCPDDDLGENRKGVVINPKLEKGRVPAGEADEENDNEGCLSVPGEHFPTARADWAKVTGTDLDGNEVVLEGHGFFARMLQHETGHLDGFVYTDVLTGRFKRQAKKTIKANGWTEPGLTWTPGEGPDPFGHDDVAVDGD